MATPLLAWNFDEASGTTVLDRSGNGRDLTISGIGVRTASGNGHTDRGLTATGGGQMNGPALTGLQTSQRTVMAWVKNTSAVIGHVLEFYVSGIDSSAWSILFLSGQIHIQARNATTLARASASWTPSATWHHIAGTYDGTNVRLYIDGNLAATTALTTPLRSDATAFRVIDNSDSSTTIDDVRLYDVALTEAEIEADMAAPVTDPPTVNEGTLEGSFSSPTADLTVTATAEVTVEGTFAAPVTAFDVRGEANAELAGSFAAPVFDASASSTPPNTGDVDGQFSAPIGSFVGTARVDVSIIGTFSVPVFTGSGGTPVSDRDILVTIGPGERPATSIAAGPPRISVAQNSFRRTEIGV